MPLSVSQLRYWESVRPSQSLMSGEKPRLWRAPATLAHLEAALAPLLVRWQSEISLDEIRLRAHLLQQTINSEPMTLFATGSLGHWIADETVLAPGNPAALLTDEEGNQYLASGGQVLAQMNPLASAARPHICQGATFGEIHSLLAEAEVLREVMAQLLTNRLVYVDDFRFYRQRSRPVQ